MDDRHCARALVLAPLVASGLALSGCMSSPTYGTDKTASEQLVGDLSNMMSFSPPKKEHIDYKPRPALVKPAPGEKEALPVPQDSITQTASAEWPESPEQRLARIRADATANQDNPFYEPQVVNDVSTARDLVPVDKRPGGDKWDPRLEGLKDNASRAEIKKRLVETKQGDPTRRKYLSEPPTDYRVAASTAPQNDIGEDEFKKEMRLKKQAAKKGDGLFGWLPW
jgi:hypothetical protein